MKKIFEAIQNPKATFIKFYCKSSRFIISDSLYLKGFYRLFMGEKLDLKNPKTFNQKIQWLKLHNKDKRYTKMVDKYGAREIIKNELGEEYLIPLLGVWNKFDDIDFNKLPNQFVLKTTHDSGSIVVCTDKSRLNIKLARNKMNSALRNNYFYFGREYPYKNVPSRIICEQYIADGNFMELRDYKFYCFNGEPKILLIASNRFADLKLDFYDMDLNLLPFTKGHYMHSNNIVTRIEALDSMIEIATKFSKGIPFLRVDLYYINSKIYFGEFTFHPEGGTGHFHPREWDKKLGDMIKLPFE